VENVIADTDTRKPEPWKGFKKTPGVLFGGGKVAVGHDTDGVSPVSCLTDAVQQNGIEEERFTAFEVDLIHSSQSVSLIEECGYLAGRERPFRLRAAADKTVFARHCTHVGCKDMHLRYHDLENSANHGI
jgi:hypothetical protein